VIDVSKAHVSATLAHPRQITCARFSPDGRFVAAAGLDERIHVTAIEGGARRTLAGHETWVVAIGFAPDGRLISADQHGTLICWDAALEKRLWTSKTPGAGFLRCLAVGPTIVTGGDDGRVRVRDNSGKIAQEVDQGSPVYAAAFHPDGSFATGDLRGVIRHGDRTFDAKILHTRGEDFLADVGGVRSLAFTRDGATLAAGGLRDAKSNTFCPGTPAVVLFDGASGRKKALFEIGTAVDGYVNALAYLADGTLCGVSESHGGNAGLYFWKEGPKPAHAAEAPSAYGLDLHPDGDRLALACYAAKGSSGNGRAAKTRADYLPNEGAVRIYALTDKPKVNADAGRPR
jgi:WD40 repeat protein